MYIISSCLAGKNCKYDGGNNRTDWIIKLMEKEDYLLICPERASGLLAPRPPAEIVNGRVVDKDGNDVTEDFVHGSDITMKIIDTAINDGNDIECAILKANSPSCGYGTIYDGTFTKEKIPGDGIFAAALKKRGIKIINENDKEMRRNYE